MIAFFAIASFFLLVAVVVALVVDPASLTPRGVTPPPAFDDAARAQAAQAAEVVIAGLAHFAALLLGIFATASIVPHALERGSIDLLLSKPVSRDLILHGKFLGSVLMVFANVGYYILGMFLVVSLKTGAWNWAFLLSAPAIVLSFVALYPSMMALGIASRSSALVIIVTYAYVYLVGPILHARDTVLAPLIGHGVVHDVLATLYYVFPKIDDLAALAAALPTHPEVSWMPVWTSLLFSAAAYMYAILLFRRKDF